MDFKPFYRALGLLGIGVGVSQLIAPRRVANLVGLGDGHNRLLLALGAVEAAAGASLLVPRTPTVRPWSRVASELGNLRRQGGAFFLRRADRQQWVGVTLAIAVVAAVGVAATMASTRRPKINPRWRYTPAGGRAGIARSAKPAPAARGRTADELVDRPFASASDSRS